MNIIDKELYAQEIEFPRKGVLYHSQRVVAAEESGLKIDISRFKRPTLIEPHIRFGMPYRPATIAGLITIDDQKAEEYYQLIQRQDITEQLEFGKLEVYLLEKMMKSKVEKFCSLMSSILDYEVKCIDQHAIRPEVLRYFSKR
jgi:hypothetical protein